MLYAVTWILMLLVSGMAHCGGRENEPESPCVVLVERSEPTSPFTRSSMTSDSPATELRDPSAVSAEIIGSPFAASFQERVSFQGRASCQEKARSPANHSEQLRRVGAADPMLLAPPATLPHGSQLAMTGHEF